MPPATTRTRPPARKRPNPPIRPRIATLMPNDQVAGRTITIGDYVIEQVNAGVDQWTAAANAFVMPGELRSWMRTGQLVANRYASGEDWHRDFTPDEQDCCDFVQRLNRANATNVAGLRIRLEQLARGGLTKGKHVVTTTPGADGNPIVTSSDTTETLLPDPDVLQWLLERTAPDIYGQRATLNVNVVDLTDTPDVKRSIEERFAAISRQLAIDVSSTEVPPP